MMGSSSPVELQGHDTMAITGVCFTAVKHVTVSISNEQLECLMFGSKW